MDYGVGDWVVRVEPVPESLQKYVKLGGKYLVKNIILAEEQWTDGKRFAVDVAFLYGVPDKLKGGVGWTADCFRKYNPPAPEIIAKHTERTV